MPTQFSMSLTKHSRDARWQIVADLQKLFREFTKPTYTAAAWSRKASEKACIVGSKTLAVVVKDVWASTVLQPPRQ